MKNKTILYNYVREWLLRMRNRYFFILDLFLLPLVAYAAFVIRLESLDLGRYQLSALIFVLAALVKVPLFILTGSYSRYWLFAGSMEFAQIIRNVFLGQIASTLLAVILLAFLGLPTLPRSVPFIDLMLSVFVVVLPRFGAQWLYRLTSNGLRRNSHQPLKRVLIAGAGEAGYLVLQEIEKNPRLALQLIGFVDDDPEKYNLNIRGSRVLGDISAIPSIVKEYHVQQVLVAIPSASAAQMRKIVDACQEAGVEVLTLPGMYELISGDVRIQRFRPVQVEDLLAREPVQTDISRVRILLGGKCVLVTGAGGSIGGELCRQIARSNPAALVLLGHGENSIFNIFNELRRSFPDLAIYPVIADTRDHTRIEQVFAMHRPEVVFHAAAHKHVPLMELNPVEAVTNNVRGTKNILAAAERWDCNHFVMISTDKAVNPVSIMGATKRVAEHLVQLAAYRSEQRFVAVRFGNVLGSRGSVVPFFQSQIEAGGPVTVTHPDICRYFMTIPEAVQLVLQAAVLGQGGEVFVLDMGEPIKIVDLARDMIHLAGLEEGKDVEIQFTGLRPGEKLYEELFVEGEEYRRTAHYKIFVSRNGKGSPQPLEENVRLLLEAADSGDLEQIYHYLRAIVPESDPALGTVYTMSAEERAFVETVNGK